MKMVIFICYDNPEKSLVQLSCTWHQTAALGASAAMAKIRHYAMKIVYVTTQPYLLFKKLQKDNPEMATCTVLNSHLVQLCGGMTMRAHFAYIMFQVIELFNESINACTV